MRKTLIPQRYLSIEILPIILIVGVKFIVFLGNLFVKVLISYGLISVVAKIIIDVIKVQFSLNDRFQVYGLSIIVHKDTL